MSHRFAIIDRNDGSPNSDHRSPDYHSPDNHPAAGYGPADDAHNDSSGHEPTGYDPTGATHDRHASDDSKSHPADRDRSPDSSVDDPINQYHAHPSDDAANSRHDSGTPAARNG